MPGGAGEGARHLEQAEAPAEGGQLRPGGAGEETGGHGHAAGQTLNALTFSSLLAAFHS